MNIQASYSAEEILDIACNVERNGASFYKQAADRFNEPKIKELFENLATWEVSHEQLFEQMKAKVKSSKVQMGEFDPEEYMQINAKAMASLSIFSIQPMPGKGSYNIQNKNEALRMALKFEQDTVRFFNGLKHFSKNTEGLEKIDDIINEEQKHIRIIRQAIEQSKTEK